MASYHCCVPHCTNDARYNKNISFHNFPSDINRKKQWLTKIRRDEGPLFQVKTHTKVCSAHFLPGDFVKTLTGMKCLAKQATPSLFSWSKDTPVRKPPTPRSQPSKRKKLESSFGEEVPATVSEKPCVTPQPEFHDYIGPVDQLTTEEKLVEATKYIDHLESKVQTLTLCKFGLHRFATDSKQLLFFTGFSSYTLIMNIFHLLRPTAEKMTRWSQVQRQRKGQCENINTDMSFHNENLQLVDQFFLFLVKIRVGLFQQDLACRFNVSQSTVSRIIITWSNFLYFQLGSLPIWLSRAKVNKYMPECFQAVYPSTRVILDCTELKIQTPSALSLNSEFYSHYKGTTTFKSLIGISPAGCVTFVSSLYAGSISDKEITKQSGIIELLENGDSVMADKGFLIQDLLDSKGAKLNIPPFLTQRDQFTKEEVEETQEIARLRIHVERAIRRVKEFHIFDSVIPISLAGSALQLWTVCCLFTLFRGPLF